MGEPLEGIAAADARLGMPFPLPTAAVPLVRWTEVIAVGEDGAGGVQVEWNLDDTRPGAPGRLVLWAGRTAPADQDLGDDVTRETVSVGDRQVALAAAPLAAAQPSLRPVTELAWRAGPLWLRLTAQGPWERTRLLAIVASVPTGRAREPV